MALTQAVPPYVLTSRSGLFLTELTIQYTENQTVKRFSGIVHHALRLFLIRCSLSFINGNDFHVNR